jgi:hypothetical protein
MPRAPTWPGTAPPSLGFELAQANPILLQTGKKTEPQRNGMTAQEHKTTLGQRQNVPHLLTPRLAIWQNGDSKQGA